MPRWLPRPSPAAQCPGSRHAWGRAWELAFAGDREGTWGADTVCRGNRVRPRGYAAIEGKQTALYAFRCAAVRRGSRLRAIARAACRGFRDRFAKTVPVPAKPPADAGCTARPSRRRRKKSVVPGAISTPPGRCRATRFIALTARSNGCKFSLQTFVDGCTLVNETPILKASTQAGFQGRWTGRSARFGSSVEHGSVGAAGWATQTVYPGDHGCP